MTLRCHGTCQRLQYRVEKSANIHRANEGCIREDSGSSQYALFPIGETIVTCSAEDLTGNTAQESFTITVQDTTQLLMLKLQKQLIAGIGR